MESVSVSKEELCLVVTLNRPDVHNAFEPKMIHKLTEIFRTAPNDKNLRCILLKGKGKSFCAGADLEWMKSMVQYDLSQNTKDSGALYDMFEAMRTCPLPVVGRVQGNIMGGGLGLLSICDIVGAEKDSRFCFSEVKLGLVPSIISSFVLRKCAISHAREFMLTGEIFNCSMAEKMGLVQFSGEPEEVDDIIQSKIDFICSNGPEAIAATKHILNFVQSHEAAETQKETIRVISERRVSAEGQEGIKAFLEKRKPQWQDQ